ncbi:uncharacterized protein LAESUDRAFT_765115 [Laetiporus sulphureus 93-53]|uniref:Cytochrome P450 n=1 Tax=Laetiporus sulphureus 93-53 TaxID=1314785 RepID=A0A165AYM1_9APHY|nr:uncharacterized protein LAESUDRAFT_765115 [Laetiporus sulphureus 93-53]KZS99904.1 hypothetical protein LAESUDRAFT_765115 [Laetiporus sulphureus 93-53]
MYQPSEAVASLLLLPVVIIIYRFSSPRLPLPPGLKPTLWAGNVHQLPASEPWLTYEKWAKEHGLFVRRSIYSTQDFLPTESLLNIFARIFPSTKQAGSSRAKRSAFICSVFVSPQLPETADAGQKVAELLTYVPSTEWEETSRKIMDIVSAANLAFSSLTIIPPTPRRHRQAPIFHGRQQFSLLPVNSDSFLTICIDATLAKGETPASPPITEFSSLSLDSASTMVSSSESASSQRTHLSNEAEFYYAGPSSGPPLVGRSSTTPWEAPGIAEAYNKPKVLRTVGRRAIKAVWEGSLSLEVVEHLDSKQVAWTSIDVVRIGYVEEYSRPVILWIGMQRGSFSLEDGAKAAGSCQGILVQSGGIDVDVEIRASCVAALEGPKLLAPTVSSDPTVDVRDPFTHTLGLPISGKLTPWAEARHVLLKPKRTDNNTFEHKSSAPRREVILLGDAAFKKSLESIQVEIGEQPLTTPYLESRIANFAGVAGDEAETEREEAGDELAKMKKAKEALKASRGRTGRRGLSEAEWHAALLHLLNAH